MLAGLKMETGEMLKNRSHTPGVYCVESCSCLCVCVHQQAEDSGEETMPAAGVMASVLAAVVAAAVIPSEAEPEVAPEEESPSSSESQKDKVGNSLPRNRQMFSR